MMFAAGWPPHMVLFFGSTTRELGAAPKVQASIAPETTCCGIKAGVLVGLDVASSMRCWEGGQHHENLGRFRIERTVKN